ncbi:MAG TPA: hypothetical protein VKR06_41520 [Ktedonosporobacter sp.]|nr:hypothetical protein [Ktedonosporobacter sp.]
MTEAEATALATTIGDAALQEVSVEAVEPHPLTGKFQVRCRYTGPTFRYQQQLFLHGMSFWIGAPHEWARMLKLVKKKPFSSPT